MSADTPPPPERPARVTFLLCAIIGGLAFTEQISNLVLPLTISRFTDDAAIIGLILMLNPAFGFIAQPLVGVLSDRIWTPIGRRAFFLVTGAPIVAICLWMLPHSAVLWHLVAAVVVYQFFQDVLWGSDHPLLADLVPPERRTFVKACLTTSTQIVAFVFLKYGMGWAMDRFGEAFIYQVGAGTQIVLVAFVALFLKERKIKPLPRPKLTIKRYITDLWGDPSLRRFAMLAFSHAIFVSTVGGFVVLFAIKTIGIERSEFGQSWSWLAMISLFCAIPLGYFAERLPKQWVLAAGYAIAMVGCVLGLQATGAESFLGIALFFGFGVVLLDVTLKPFFTEFLPADLVGQLSGAYNICFAVGRSMGLAGAGWVVSRLNNDYTAIWWIALFFGATSIAIALSIRDGRYDARQQRKTVIETP